MGNFVIFSIKMLILKDFELKPIKITVTSNIYTRILNSTPNFGFISYLESFPIATKHTVALYQIVHE